MKLIKVTKSSIRCRGYDGRHHPIFTGFRYVKLRYNKALCECCYDKIESDDSFWRELLNKFKG